MGVPAAWEINDVYGLEPELLSMLPQPALARSLPLFYLLFFCLVMNSFLRKMGVPAAWEINDVYGLEPELLSMLPQPALALLLLFPINDKGQSHGLIANNFQPRINCEPFSVADPFLGFCRDPEQDPTLRVHNQKMETFYSYILRSSD